MLLVFQSLLMPTQDSVKEKCVPRLSGNISLLEQPVKTPTIYVISRTSH